MTIKASFIRMKRVSRNRMNGYSRSLAIPLI